ncbi:hypothetical protein LTR09_008567 [Extremus antarcticus]|uniref:Uncharacterized protein n=1 Tax=Extremus antarcticus TaxID=702011 RepID=A0AAJ0DAA9_9PEZI|nr:hypothetical protein LTR09_008567 [Extremus antarcticus]
MCVLTEKVRCKSAYARPHNPPFADARGADDKNECFGCRYGREKAAEKWQDVVAICSTLTRKQLTTTKLKNVTPEDSSSGASSAGKPQTPKKSKRASIGALSALTSSPGSSSAAKLQTPKKSKRSSIGALSALITSPVKPRLVEVDRQREPASRWQAKGGYVRSRKSRSTRSPSRERKDSAADSDGLPADDLADGTSELSMADRDKILKGKTTPKESTKARPPPPVDKADTREASPPRSPSASPTAKRTRDAGKVPVTADEELSDGDDKDSVKADGSAPSDDELSDDGDDEPLPLPPLVAGRKHPGHPISGVDDDDLGLGSGLKPRKR